VKRAAKNIFSNAQSVVDEYNNALDELMQEFRDRAVHDTHINVHRVLDIMEDLSLDSMAYAGGAGLNTTKQCLDGTRVDILKEIVDWINDPAVNVPRIFWQGKIRHRSHHCAAVQGCRGPLFMLLLRARSAVGASRGKDAVKHCL